MAGRTGLNTFSTITDFACGQVLTHEQLNQLKDNQDLIDRRGETVISIHGGKPTGKQHVIVGYHCVSASPNLDADSDYPLYFAETLTDRHYFENAGYDKYVLNVSFNPAELDNTYQATRSGPNVVYFTQKIQVLYGPGSSPTQTLMDSSLSQYGGPYDYNTLHQVCLSGSINTPPSVSTTRRDQLILRVENTIVSSSITEGDWFRISAETTFGGITSVNLKLHN